MAGYVLDDNECGVQSQGDEHQVKENRPEIRRRELGDEFGIGDESQARPIPCDLSEHLPFIASGPSSLVFPVSTNRLTWVTGTSSRCAMKPRVENMAKPPKILVKPSPKLTVQVSL